jgi:hypothetical protein
MIKMHLIKDLLKATPCKAKMVGSFGIKPTWASISKHKAIKVKKAYPAILHLLVALKTSKLCWICEQNDGWKGLKEKFGIIL